MIVHAVELYYLVSTGLKMSTGTIIIMEYALGIKVSNARNEWSIILTPKVFRINYYLPSSECC
jgi:hypothetical protein